MIKRIKNKILITALILFASNGAFAVEYKDIPHGFWAYKEIDSLSDAGVITGYSYNKFLPQKLVTRAEYASIVVKALKQENYPIDEFYSFEDIDKSHWAWNSILVALSLDILKPSDNGYFYPNAYVTCSEVITFLVNLLKTEHITKKEAMIALQNAYDDFDDIPDWFKYTAGKAEVLGVIAKEPPRENYLDYDKFVTRAQMAVFLANMKKETDKYIAQKVQEETSPKFAQGIVIDSVYMNGDVVTLPRKTLLPIMISGQLSTKTTSAGEMFQARFFDNIVDGQNHLLFSKDVVLVGKVLSSVKAKNLIRNGEMIFEISSVNNKNLYTKITAVAQGEVKSAIKGKDYTIKDGQIIYIKLLQPIRVNVVTGEILD